MSIMIRKMEPRDLGIVSHLMFELTGHEISEAQMQNRLEMVEKSDINELYVCEAEGNVLGVFGFRIRENLEEVSRFGEISVIVTHSESRRMGIGKAMMAYAEKLASEHGCIGTWLVTDLDREEEAHRFYQSLGYTINGYRFIKPLPKLGAEDQAKRYLTATFQAVEVERDIVYGKVTDYQGGALELLLDLYMPQGDQQASRPVILFMHSGGFQIGRGDKTKKHIVRLAEEFARKGYVGISINYRLRQHPEKDWEGTFEDAVHDAGLAIEWIRENASQYRLNPEWIALCGSSAGGMIGAILCTRKNGNKAGVKALVNLWGSPEPRAFSEIDDNTPPVLILHGTKDEIVPYQFSEKLAETLRAHQIETVLQLLEGAAHSPLERDPNSPYWKPVIESMTEFLLSLSQGTVL